MLKDSNHMVLVLLVKKESPLNAQEYMPITCCTVMYKIISKLLCQKLKEALPTIVDLNQGAFVQERSILHKVLLSQDLMRGYDRARISPRCIMNIDLRKAHDSVAWDFLMELLEGLSFPIEFITWIQNHVCIVSYTLNINGELHWWINVKRGLRQGDLVSPLLIVIVMNI